MYVLFRHVFQRNKSLKIDDRRRRSLGPEQVGHQHRGQQRPLGGHADSGGPGSVAFVRLARHAFVHLGGGVFGRVDGQTVVGLVVRLASAFHPRVLVV